VVRVAIVIVAVVAAVVDIGCVLVLHSCADCVSQHVDVEVCCVDCVCLIVIDVDVNISVDRCRMIVERQQLSSLLLCKLIEQFLVGCVVVLVGAVCAERRAVDVACASCCIVSGGARDRCVSGCRRIVARCRVARRQRQVCSNARTLTSSADIVARFR
jgi:hypothetical protein